MYTIRSSKYIILFVLMKSYSQLPNKIRARRLKGSSEIGRKFRDAVRADKRNNVLARPRGGCSRSRRRPRADRRTQKNKTKRKRSVATRRNVKKGGEEEIRLYRLLGAHLVFPPVVFISRTGETFRSVVREIPGQDFLRGS